MAETEITLGGLPVVTLTTQIGEGVVRADVAPGRGMMLLQAAARLGDAAPFDLMDSPALGDLPQTLDGGADDFVGNAAFSIGGAILLPYANRIRGREVGDRMIETQVGDQTVRLPMNWGGKAPGAEHYAMHGLILDLAVRDWDQPTPDVLHGRVASHDWGGRWPSRADLDFTWRLSGGGLEMQVGVTNVGDERMPVGVGWHPYFRLASGDRRQARLHLPASRRLIVNNYDEVLPTGREEAIAGTAYDVAQPGGLRLGDLYLDDCFVGLQASAGGLPIDILDPASGRRVRVWSCAPEVQAVQVFAPTDRPIVVVEPQFNWADPFAPFWAVGGGKGMVVLAPGEATAYRARVEVSAL